MSRLPQVKIRIGPTIWHQVQEMADEDGISASQWVREAALIRLSYRLAAGDPDVAAAAERIARELIRGESGAES